MARHGLCDTALVAIRAALEPVAARLTDVAVFGSRAMGRSRPASDIDLVLYGPLSDADVARESSLLDDSALAVRCDLHA